MSSWRDAVVDVRPVREVDPVRRDDLGCTASATPASIADAAVSALKVEPGSNGAVKAREPRSASAVPSTLFGSTEG